MWGWTWGNQLSNKAKKKSCGYKGLPSNQGLGTPPRHLFCLHHHPPLQILQGGAGRGEGKASPQSQPQTAKLISNPNHGPSPLGHHLSYPTQLFLIIMGLRDQTKQPPLLRVEQHREGWSPEH